MRSPEVIRTWRSAMQSAVRQYGAGPEVERTARVAVRRSARWLAKHPERALWRRARAVAPAERA